MEGKRLGGLNFVRALAFFLIFISHTGITGCAFGGPAGVEIFFLLSGFLLFWNYTDRTMDFSIRGRLRFAWHKIKKLYPLHLLTLLVGIMLDVRLYGMASGSRLVSTAVKSVLNLLLQSWIPKASFYFSFNSVSWYLSVLFFLYFMFPWVLQRLKKYKYRRTAVVVICSVIMIETSLTFGVSLACRQMSVSEDITKWFTYINPVYRLGDFIIGCNLGYLFRTALYTPRSGRVPFKWRNTSLEFLALLLLILPGILYNRIISVIQGACPQAWWIWSLLFLPSAGFLICAFSMGGALSHWLNCIPIRGIAAISPYAFLIHQLVIRIIGPLIPDWHIRVIGYSYVNAGICLAITIVLCTIYKFLTVCLAKKRTSEYGLSENRKRWSDGI